MRSEEHTPESGKQGTTMELHGTFEIDSVLAVFRETGSYDPDILDGRLTDLLDRADAVTRKGTLFLVLGSMATVTLVGSPLGFPLVLAGFCLRQTGARHVSAVRRAFDLYTRPQEHSIEPRNPKSKGETK